MKELLTFVPEDKQAEFLKAAEGYAKLSDETVVGYVKTKPDAVVQFAASKEGQSFRDKISTPVVEARFKNYEETKLAERLAEEREKVRKELHPDETPEQKRIRELEQRIAASDAETAKEKRKRELREKATSLGYDPANAERLYALPDADEVLETLAKESKVYKDKIDALEKKQKYGTNPPPSSNGSGNVITEAEFNSMEPKARAEFMAKGGRLE